MPLDQVLLCRVVAGCPRVCTTNQIEPDRLREDGALSVWRLRTQRVQGLKKVVLGQPS